MDTYLVVGVILFVEAARGDMVALVPDRVLNSCVVRVVHDDLVLGDLVASAVLVLAVRQLEDLVRVLASERRVAVLRRHRWPHVREHHRVVSGHLPLCRLCLF